MKYGVFTGRKIEDYISDTGSDFVGARKVINGNDKARDIALIACGVRLTSPALQSITVPPYHKP